MIPQGGDARHRHQRPAVLGEDTRRGSVARPLVGLRRDLLAVHHGGRARRRQRPAGARRGAEGVLFVVEGELTVDARRRSAMCCSPAATPSCRRRCALDGCATTASEPARFHWIRKAYEVGRRARRARGDGHQRAGRSQPIADAGHRGPLGDDPLRRPGRPAPRHARHHRHPRARRRHPVRRDPRDGARPLRAGGQGGLPAQPATGSRSRPATIMWLRAFCPQACYAGGPGRFRYLLYKDVNRHPRLR